jgi:pilus assembly protein CpaC
VQLDARTDRIPGIGDLPYIGPLFSNNSNRRIEKELLVLVTPYLVTPMNPDQVPALPGSDIKDPTDCEFYLKNHMVGRTETGYRATANWNDPLGMVHRMKVEKRCISGPVGYSE